MKPEEFLKNCDNIIIFEQLVNEYPEIILSQLEKAVNIPQGILHSLKRKINFNRPPLKDLKLNLQYLYKENSKVFLKSDLTYI